MSFLHKPAPKYKAATSRTYRLSRAPYQVNPAPTQTRSFLSSGSVAVSARTFDKRNKALQDAYEATLKDQTAAEKQELNDLRAEAGWEGSSSQAHYETNKSPVDIEDSDEDWIDEEPFGYLSAALSKCLRSHLSQSWSERLAKEGYSWEREMSGICDEFLAYNHNGPPSSSSSPDLQSSESAKVVSVLCIHLTSREKINFTVPDSNTSLLRTLVRHGFIPPTPTAPAFAIHIDVLRYCAALRRHASIVSLQSIMSAICEVHNIPYAKHFRTQLSAALDVYLAITRMVDSRLAKSMSRDHPDWRMANACAACTYRLKDEPALEHSVLLTCDGNDSVKRVANASVVDRHTFHHSYFLENDYVDRFENEVKRSVKAKAGKGEASGSNLQNDTSTNIAVERATGNAATDIPADESVTQHAASHCAGEDNDDKPCEQRWKNARADETSGKKLVVFDETGIFVVSCRHGTVVLVEDMRQSGELSKYGLAAVDTLARVFGKNILLGYDIGCTFRGTALRSPLVGRIVKEMSMKFVVGSFHGYAHQRKCQLSNHPTHVKGAGLESFEQNEQLFSSTNDVARTTRHASAFHRRQHLALRLGAWDEDRRRNIGFVFKARYTRALDAITTLPKEIRKLCPDKTDDDWRAMFEAERSYFNTLQAPSPESSFAMDYLKALRNLTEKQKAFNAAFEISAEHTPSTEMGNGNNTYSRLVSRTQKLETQRRHTSEQLSAAQVEVAALERERSINPRWTPGCAEWEAAVEREAREHYYEKLRYLELLVVQRIAELEKTHMMGTGYNSRKKISKSVNQREKTLHNALDQYNKAARALDPPRPTLQFKDLTECAYVADFDFLKYSEHGALEAEWARPVHRQCITSWHKLERAKEEIVRLNVEIRRVRTHIQDEELFLSKQFQVLNSTNPDLAHALLQRLQLTFRINKCILRDLEAISKLKGFSGDLSCGLHVGSGATPPQPESPGDLSASNAPQALVEVIGQLALEEDIPPAGTEDLEPSDEALHVMTSVEDCCKVM
ncbi:hypothetical protein FRC09_005418 [Ceratobasidium sp. 395]|nr:hypothetical protein FRC09_005418 [Ceratobasidium sp. 395]